MAGTRHRMPWGADIGPGESVRFRLWAPDAVNVDLVLDDTAPAAAQGTGLRSALIAMQPAADGWFELTTEAAGHGSRYRYRIDGRLDVPDPASRSQPDGVAGPSEVVDAARYRWRDDRWAGRPWRETVLYELHVGTFTATGTFDAAIERLAHLEALGVTAVEIMPVATFAGNRGWGYDGVLPFAPHAAYGGPDAFRRFVEAAHAHGIGVLLDVVYNHFGPEGNYLHAYARGFFTHRHLTPWGDAINYDGARARPVRDFFIHNALCWLEEYRLDGLRLDAVHAIVDDSSPHILEELADRVHSGPGRERDVHLVLENERNNARYLRAGTSAGRHARYAAQWNDDFHHAAHTLLTREAEAYYSDFAADPVQHLQRCLCEGFAWQGEPSPFGQGRPRGEASADLPSTAFIDFLQNHDQVGNRAFGDRLASLAEPDPLRVLTSVLLLNPAIPALFMGEEFASETPFLYFADFSGELADAVRNGRRREFAGFAAFGAKGDRIPDPVASSTFEQSKLDWERPASEAGRSHLALCRELLAIRREAVVPRLPAAGATSERRGDNGLSVRWRLADGSLLVLDAAFGDSGGGPLPGMSASREPHLLHAEPRDAATAGAAPAWFAVWHLVGNGS